MRATRGLQAFTLGHVRHVPRFPASRFHCFFHAFVQFPSNARRWLGTRACDSRRHLSMSWIHSPPRAARSGTIQSSPGKGTSELPVSARRDAISRRRVSNDADHPPSPMAFVQCYASVPHGSPTKGAPVPRLEPARRLSRQQLPGSTGTASSSLSLRLTDRGNFGCIPAWRQGTRGSESLSGRSLPFAAASGSTAVLELICPPS